MSLNRIKFSKPITIRIGLLFTLLMFVISSFAYVLVYLPSQREEAAVMDISAPGVPPFDYKSDVFFFYTNVCPYCHQQINTTFTAARALGLDVQKVNIQASAEGWNFYGANVNVSNCSGLPFTIIQNRPHGGVTSLCGMYTEVMFNQAYNGETVTGFVNMTYEQNSTIQQKLSNFSEKAAAGESASLW